MKHSSSECSAWPHAGIVHCNGSSYMSVGSMTQWLVTIVHQLPPLLIYSLRFYIHHVYTSLRLFASKCLYAPPCDGDRDCLWTGCSLMCLFSPCTSCMCASKLRSVPMWVDSSRPFPGGIERSPGHAGSRLQVRVLDKPPRTAISVIHVRHGTGCSSSVLPSDLEIRFHIHGRKQATR